jgi:diaminopropionate ammonia-lyase
MEDLLLGDLNGWVLNVKIFISEFVSESRAEAMRNLGADVIRVKGNYDASLKECIKQSKNNNWEIVQDVSWEGIKLYQNISWLVTQL